jgi:hypothetical protein
MTWWQPIFSSVFSSWNTAAFLKSNFQIPIRPWWHVGTSSLSPLQEGCLPRHKADRGQGVARCCPLPPCSNRDLCYGIITENRTHKCLQLVTDDTGRQDFLFHCTSGIDNR